MDGGSVERWEDPGYRSVYERILQGDWEGYDAWQMGETISKCHLVLVLVPKLIKCQIRGRLPCKTCTMVLGLCVMRGDC